MNPQTGNAGSKCLAKTIFFYFSLSLILISCSQHKKNPAGWVDEERLLKAEEEPGNWMSLGRNFMQQHHSTLKEINTENVKNLGYAWEYKTNSNRGPVYRGLEATPIVVDGMMYTSGAWSQVYAVDAKTGKEIWRYDPDVDGNYARKACCDVVNRGVQVWKGKVYVGTLDGYLICLDAATGKLIWKENTFIDRTAFYTITGPPQIAKDKVIIGNSGADFGVRGYVSAYDAETGKFAWRFFTVPGDPKKGFEHPEMEMAAKTWDPNSDWKAGGGGSVWGEMAYDPNLNLLYVGTGNSSPYPSWYRSPKGGDNLFLVSILAINPDNGKMAWYYQTTPAENWDFTCTMNIILADLKINGEDRKVLMQAPKNGFFYVLDRTNGKLISAKKYVPVNWADSVDLKTGRPVTNGNGWYKDSAKVIFPGPPGGHNWMPMSFNPQTGLVYIPTLDLPFIYKAIPDYAFRTGYYNMYADQMPVVEAGEKNAAPEFFVLKAWDPVTQKEVWRISTESAPNGGVLSTNGNLVLQGSTSGHFFVYRADNGQLLKDIFTGTGIMAAPITYEVDGQQYIAVMAGFGGATLAHPDEHDAIINYSNEGRIIAFKINGTSVPLPRRRIKNDSVFKPPTANFDKRMIAEGEKIYQSLCSGCHADFGNHHFNDLPDLSMMSAPIHQSFTDILLKGKLSYYGMANFSDVLKPADVESLHQFLISVQKERFEKATRRNTKNH
jgi:quinohemoprotein ethanol dehydrogenase